MADTINYVDGEIEGVEIRYLKTYTDNRGWLIEVFRHDDLAKDRWPVMTYISSTLPGVARGPHEHVDQTDGFAFLGPSDFKLYLWDARPDSKTYGHKHVEVLGQSRADGAHGDVDAVPCGGHGRWSRTGGIDRQAGRRRGHPAHLHVVHGSARRRGHFVSRLRDARQ